MNADARGSERGFDGGTEGWVGCLHLDYRVRLLAESGKCPRTPGVEAPASVCRRRSPAKGRDCVAMAAIGLCMVLVELNGVGLYGARVWAILGRKEP